MIIHTIVVRGPGSFIGAEDPNTMTDYLFVNFINVALLCFSGALANRDAANSSLSIEDSFNNTRVDNYDNGVFKNTTSDPNYFEDVEVPDSALLVLNRLNLRMLAATKYYEAYRSRQTQPQKPQKPQKPQNGTQLEDEEEEEEEGQTSLAPCSCTLGVCKCCTGYVLDLFNQKACMQITYHPGDFAFDVAMSMNDRVLFENSMSGKNPKPVCISPPRINNLKVCAQFFDVFFPGRNFHFCLKMTGRWQQYELFNRPFNCLRMGANGIAVMSPEDNGGLTIPNPQGGVDAVIDAGNDEDIEEYDENVVKSFFSIFDDDDRK